MISFYMLYVMITGIVCVCLYSSYLLYIVFIHNTCVICVCIVCMCLYDVCVFKYFAFVLRVCVRRYVFCSGVRGENDALHFTCVCACVCVHVCECVFVCACPRLCAVWGLYFSLLK